MDCESNTALLSWQQSAGAEWYHAVALGAMGLEEECQTSDTNCELSGLTCGDSFSITVRAIGAVCSSQATMSGQLVTGECARRPHIHRKTQRYTDVHTYTFTYTSIHILSHTHTHTNIVYIHRHTLTHTNRHTHTNIPTYFHTRRNIYIHTYLTDACPHTKYSSPFGSFSDTFFPISLFQLNLALHLCHAARSVHASIRE